MITCAICGGRFIVFDELDEHTKACPGLLLENDINQGEEDV